MALFYNPDLSDVKTFVGVFSSSPKDDHFCNFDNVDLCIPLMTRVYPYLHLIVGELQLIVISIFESIFDVHHSENNKINQMEERIAFML